MNQSIIKQERSSNIELFRVIVMLLIVAHHFVVNSGVMEYMTTDFSDWRSMFLWLFGAWGKVGINCFVLITGYYMCTSQITLRKFLKLVFEIEFYKIVIYGIFAIVGREEVSWLRALEVISPITSYTTDFISSYLILFLFIPFLNILIKGLTQRNHLLLIGLCLLFFSVLCLLPGIKIPMAYPIWFIVVYIIGAYLRLYKFENKIAQYWLGGTNLWMVVVAIASIYVSIALMKTGIYPWGPYHWLMDSNAILAVLSSITLFNYFLNLNINQNKYINLFGATSFGVLLIHANSDAMRSWLWGDTINVVGHFGNSNMPFYAMACVFGIYLICSVLDYIRIQTIEKGTLGIIDQLIKRIS